MGALEILFIIIIIIIIIHERAKKELQKMVNDEYDRETRRANRLDNSTVTIEIPKKLSLHRSEGLEQSDQERTFPNENDWGKK